MLYGIILGEMEGQKKVFHIQKGIIRTKADAKRRVFLQGII
jgi:hypothetical protein